MGGFDLRIGQRFMVGFHGLTAPDYLLKWIAEGRVAGVILFARNIDNPQQVADLTRSLHEASEQPILVSIDQEGGIVARLRHGQGFTESSGAMALAASQNRLGDTATISGLLADEMRAVGINWTYAPVLDLSYNASNPTVGTRSFGVDPVLVGQLAIQAVKGFQEHSVIATAKHFPGLGNTNIDSHLDLPVLDTPLDDLIAQDLEPYRQVIGDVASIMTTHTVFKTLDEQHPATLSDKIIQELLRDRLSYDGVVITDCLEMHAITKHYGEGDAAVRALMAGVDIVLISHTRSHQEAAFDAVIQAVERGELSDDNLNIASQRIEALRTAYAINPNDINPQAVGTNEHFQVALSIAKSGVSLDGTLPKLSGQSIAVVEFTAQVESEVSEKVPATSLASKLQDHFSDASYTLIHALNPLEAQIQKATTAVKQADIVVIVTRNAHRYEAQLQIARDLLGLGEATILVALRNPYDADVLSADAVLCTYGDSVVSMEAVVSALMGEFQPTGQRPAIVVVE